MPWGDCTGPWWMSPRGYRASGYVPMNPWCRGRGMGFGRGFRGQAFAAPWYDPVRDPMPAEEISYLEDVAKQLEEDLKGVKERINKLRSNQ